MKHTVRIAVAALLGMGAAHCAAWGPDGHSIVAEIAARRLDGRARAAVQRLLGAGHSLASEASWADDARQDRPETFKWHFVDVPLAQATYDEKRDCAATPRGDCVVAELERIRRTLRCGRDDARREALRWAVHLVADLHQPLHTIAEEQGGNTVAVEVSMGGLRCARCTPARTTQNLHWVWDTSLIAATAWSWGAYVRRLEDGWLRTPEAREAAGGSVIDWANETHAAAREVWSWTSADPVIGDDYYRRALPVLDRQLGRAGLRLAAFLDDAFAPGTCGRGRPRARR